MTFINIGHAFLVDPLLAMTYTSTSHVSLVNS